MMAGPTVLVGAESVKFPQARLSVLEGPDKGRQLLLEGGTLVIGSDPRSDFAVTDQTVSRRHAELTGGPSGWRIRDLKSTNGIVVEGLRVADAWLLQPSRLQLGKTVLRFEPLRKQIEWPLSAAERFGRAVGKSAAMRRVFAVLERVAPTDASLLLEGEPGVGKTLLARTLHAESNRSDAALVEVDVAAEEDASALARVLLGGEGASGAVKDAEGGTLLLHDVTKIPAALQMKLVRALEAHPPKGGAGVRVVATSTVDAQGAKEAGTLKEELFYKVAAFRVRVPPLRERPEDIPLLTEHFLERAGRAGSLPGRTLELLASHDYPGNVGELANAIERLAAFPELGAGAISGLAASAAGGEKRGGGAATALDEELLKLPYHDAKERLLAAFDRRYLSEHLARSRGHVARAAQRIGVPRQSLYRMLKALGIRGADGDE